MVIIYYLNKRESNYPIHPVLIEAPVSEFMKIN